MKGAGRALQGGASTSILVSPWSNPVRLYSDSISQLTFDQIGRFLSLIRRKKFIPEADVWSTCIL